ALAAWALWRRRATTTGSAESMTSAVGRRVATAAPRLAALWILAHPRALAAAFRGGRPHPTPVRVAPGGALLVVLSRGSTLLVDAGGLAAGSSFDVGDRVVAPVIRSAGVRRLDYLALSHGDPDHIGGAASVVREFRPREVWEGIPVPRLEALTSLRAD